LVLLKLFGKLLPEDWVFWQSDHRINDAEVSPEKLNEVINMLNELLEVLLADTSLFKKASKFTSLT
jgi:hypothetical protein